MTTCCSRRCRSLLLSFLSGFSSLSGFSLLRGFSILCGFAVVLSFGTELSAQEQQPSDQEVEQYAKDGTTEINVKNADIAAIVRIFSKKTKRNYILDENVKGKVTIYLPGKVTSDEAIRILESVLALKGFTSVPIGENLWKIVPAKIARQSTIPTLMEGVEGQASAAMVTRLLNLKFVSADDVKQLVTPLVSGDGLVNAYTGTNSLIIIDNADNIQRLDKLIAELDVPFSDREMTIIPIEHADATEIADKLNEILGSGEKQAAGGAPQDSLDLIRARIRESAAEALVNRSPGSPPPAGGGGITASGASSRTIGARSREPKIIPDQRTNSIIVVADEDTTARIQALVSQLDSKVDLSGNRFYVYRCQHAKADELAQVLAGLGGEAGGGARATTTGLSSAGSGASDLGSSLSSSTGNRSAGRLTGQQRTPGRPRSESQGGAPGGGTFNLGEGIQITADPATNSLIIHSSKADYEKLKALIDKLDIKRRQVLVEAILLEVAVDNSQTLSTEFTTSTGGADGAILAKSDFGNLAQLLQDPTRLSNFSVAAASSGTLTLPGNITIPTQSILLTAARSNSNVNVLSAPNILTTDNEEAEIVVGQNVPFLASTSTSETNLNNTFNQIERQDVGITLRITPQISSGESVTLKIFTEVSNVIAATLASPLGPTTTIRTSETTVITKDSQMVVIGGLMSDDVTESESGVPFLSEVPVLGHLFRTASEARRRTNLLIFITPRVIQNQFDHRDVTRDQRDVLEQEMQAIDAWPPRDEVLRNLNMDRVVEGQMYDGPKPGTVTGSRSTPPADPAAAEGEPISLRVSPRLPHEGEQARTGGATGAQFVVLQLADPSTAPANLPFGARDEGGRFGVTLGGDSADAARSFFQVGQRYAYRVDGKEVGVLPLGVFTSLDQVRKMYPDLSANWYVLSPYEIMNLGQGPWVKSR